MDDAHNNKDCSPDLSLFQNSSAYYETIDLKSSEYQHLNEAINGPSTSLRTPIESFLSSYSRLINLNPENSNNVYGKLPKTITVKSIEFMKKQSAIEESNKHLKKEIINTICTFLKINTDNLPAQPNITIDSKQIIIDVEKHHGINNELYFSASATINLTPHQWKSLIDEYQTLTKSQNPKLP